MESTQPTTIASPADSKVVNSVSSNVEVTTPSSPTDNDSDATMTPSLSTHNWIIRCRGLPWSCTTDDVVAFFEPVRNIAANNIHIIREYDGRVSGQCFVEFPDEASRDEAIEQRNKKHIGDRYLELYKGTREELDCYLRRSAHAHSSMPMHESSPPMVPSGKEVVRLRGLPFSTTDVQVQRWFEDHGYNVDINAIAIGYYPDGRLTGESWVYVDDKQEVINKLNKESMGRRYIEVFPSMPAEFEAAKLGGISSPGFGRSPPMNSGYGGYRENNGGYGGRKWGGAHGGYNNQLNGYSNSPGAYGQVPPYGTPPPQVYGGGPPPMMMPTQQGTWSGGNQGPANVSPLVQGEFTCLRLRGLPYHANENNIVEFFSGFHMKAILPSTVPVHNRPSGEAYVEYHGADECMRAYRQKNGAMMDRRYIELFPSSKQEMDWAADGMDPREIRKRLGGGR